jgi:hypothetical protein
MHYKTYQSFCLCIETTCLHIAHVLNHFKGVSAIQTSLACTRCIRCRCIRHMCVISTMFGSCFCFLKKLFFSNNYWSPPASPWSFAFLTPFLYPVDPLTSVLHISHSGSLPRRPPHPGPSHFSLQFFNPSIPPHPVLHISHYGSLTRRSPPPGLSHFPLRFFNPSIPPAWSFTFPTSVL